MYQKLILYAEVLPISIEGLKSSTKVTIVNPQSDQRLLRLLPVPCVFINYREKWTVTYFIIKLVQKYLKYFTEKQKVTCMKKRRRKALAVNTGNEFVRWEALHTADRDSNTRS